jgi:tryptophan-rich sensory protein
MARLQVGTVLDALTKKKRYRWYHGAAFLMGITLVERGLEALAKKANPAPIGEDDRGYYTSLTLARFAPPGLAFPIAWAINDIAAVWGTLLVLNKPTGTPGRQEFLYLQAASWGVYSLFTALHFGLRSPLNALVLTTLHAGLNTASVTIHHELNDQRVALSLVPVLAWLTIALPTAATTALWNRDRLYKLGPFVESPAKWLKAG